MSTKLVWPGDKLTWAFDWVTSWLVAGDSVSSYAWTLYDGPAASGDVVLVNDTTATVTVPEGLVSGKVYRLRTAIETAAGLKKTEDITIRCG